MWRVERRRRTLLFQVLGNAAAAFAMTSPSPLSSAPPPPPSAPAFGRANVLLASSRLIPLFGSATVAHRTRRKALDLLRETAARRNDGERAMVVDISATTWNWDTYAVVAGTPQPIRLVFPDRVRLTEHLPLEREGGAEVVRRGTLVPQPAEKGETTPTRVWVPKGAILRKTERRDDGAEDFVLEAPVDPNDDRLEHWEQEVLGRRHIHRTRAKLAAECMRNMLRFYELDRVVCWDLSWGVWEAVRESENTDDGGFPRAVLSKEGGEKIYMPSFDGDGDEDAAVRSMYDCARPVSPALLAETLKGVSGYYLVGGNTYTMSLFHHMWDQQDDKGGHIQLLQNLLKDGTLFYLGHSAGAIMSGPNILTATFKGIDAFSIVTQPYNAPFLRLPPSESPETFFVAEKNDLTAARTRMLEKMRRYDAWRGHAVVRSLTFPHYDARPRPASFPHSAATYLRATDACGRFAQPAGSLTVGGAEPADVGRIREETVARGPPCYPIANGHAVLMQCGGSEAVEALSPEEEGGGTLHWDTYMPNVKDEDYLQYAPGRNQFAAGSFTEDEHTVAGDRSSTSQYDGARIFSRLDALGLPNPTSDGKGKEGDLFRS